MCIIDIKRIYELTFTRLRWIITAICVVLTFCGIARAQTDRPAYLPMPGGAIIPIYPVLTGGHELGWNDLFQEHGESGLFQGHEWIGGDGGISVELPDRDGKKRTLWLYGDTHFGSRVNGRNNMMVNMCGLNMAVQYQTYAEFENHDPGYLERDTGAQFPYWVPNREDRIAGESWLPPNLYYDGSISPVIGIDYSDSLNEAMYQFYSRNWRNDSKVVFWGGEGLAIGPANQRDLVILGAPITMRPEIDGTKANGTIIVSIGNINRSVWNGWGHSRYAASWSEAPLQVYLYHDDASPEWSTGTGRFFNQFAMTDRHDPTTVYVYGKVIQETGLYRYILAKVENVNDRFDFVQLDNWKFYNENDGWVHDPDNATYIMTTKPNLLVFPDAFDYNAFTVMWSSKLDKYVMITNAGIVLHGDDSPPGVLFRTAPDPWGPWTDKYIFDFKDCPGSPDQGLVSHADNSSNKWSWYGINTYQVRAHPEHSDDDSVLVSYISNWPLPPAEWGGPPYYYYTPRFVRIPWADVRDFEKSNKVRCDRWEL